MKKIEEVVFIEAKSPSSHIFSFVEMFRLGSLLLATILKNLGLQTKVFIEDIKEIYDEEKDEIIREELFQADMICISTITSTAIRAYKIAKKFRDKNIIVAIGGVHVTFLPDEGLEHADYVVRGEGEETLVELIDCLNHSSGKTLYDIPGLSFKTSKGGKIVHNDNRPLVEDLDAAPIPDFSLVADWQEKNVIPIATSRGCPFACKFCSVVPMFGREMRFKSVARVMEEIRNALKNNPRHIFFIDDNAAANKKRFKEICRAIISSNFSFNWSAQVRTDILKDPELIQLMARAGCINVFIGFESIDPQTLIAYDKKQEVNESERCIGLLHESAINIHGMFVINPDINNAKLVWNTVKYAKKMKLSSLQLLAYTPLPGSPVFVKMEAEGRLLHRDWSKYDAHHAVIQHPLVMSISELQIELLKGMRSFYNWPYSLKWLLSAILSPLDRQAFIEGFFYAKIGFYGRRLTKAALEESADYLQNLQKHSVGQIGGKTTPEDLNIKSVVQNFGSL